MTSAFPYRILGVTLARGGSKSIPRKNIVPLCGLPMIAYTIAEARRSRYISRYIVSTDDAEIRQVALDYGAEAPFLRPDVLAGDRGGSMEALQHAVGWIEHQEGKPYDYVIELMCTNPLKTHEDMDGAVEKLIRTGADSVVGVTRVLSHHPSRIKKIVDDKLVAFDTPESDQNFRQDLKPEAFIRNGSFFCIKRDLLMLHNKRYSTENCRPYIMPPERSIDIDEPLDLKVAEALLEQNPKPDGRPVATTP